MRKNLAALLCASLLVGGPTAALATQAGYNVILGGLVLGETTREAFRDQMDQKGYPVSQMTEDGFDWDEMSASCLGLPAQKIRIYHHPGDERGVVVAVAITFEKNFGSVNFKNFASSLQKKYGQPVRSVLPFVGNKEIVWTTDLMRFTLREPHMSFEGTIEYVTRELDEQLRQSQENREQQKREQLDAMI